MSKKSGRKGQAWRGRREKMPLGDWLRGLFIIAAMALIAWGAFMLSDQGADAYTPEIVISRLMTSNPSACYGVQGKYYDWLELQNVSGEYVSLKGWQITDNGDLRGAFTFGDVALAPGERLMTYCDEAPEGFDGPEIFTGFKLSSDGETLLLADPHQRIQSLEVPALSKRSVFQRDPATGRYTELSFRDAIGKDAANASTLTPPFNPNGVTISEVMAVNRSTLSDEDGDCSDWIELYNPSKQTVSLKGCALSDDDANRLKWVFPNVKLKSGEYLVVFCSGKNRRNPKGELHTNFKLSGSGEAVRLFNPNADAISWVRYSRAMADVSFSRMSDGAMTAHIDPSPGHPNTPQGARDAIEGMKDNELGLYINEVFTSGKGADWVELYNAGDGERSLGGMGLSDDPVRPRKWQFPSEASIAAKGYLLVRLAGAQEDPAVPPADIKVAAPEGSESATVPVKADYTADFGLSQGETLCLTTDAGRVIERVKLYDQAANVSYGRAEGHGEYRFFSQPTPGAANAEKSYAKVATPIVFSTPPGIVRDQQIQLRLSTTPGVTIYYTTDGSEPTANSTRYENPITLSKNTCIRAVARGEDVIPSEEAVASFIFARHTVRLVSITGSRRHLIGSKGTLVTGVRGSGYDVYVEMYEPDGQKLIGQKCHLTCIGHNSRTTMPQKSIRLTARRSTGDTRFRARLFSNRDYDEVKSVVLRASGQDATQTFMRDSILTSLAADTNVFYQETELCVVYVNGTYWGVYNMREHRDAHSICQFEGWENPDDVRISEGSGTQKYKNLLSWVSSHDMSSDANVETLRTMMDIENYLDYVILEMYSCNQDLNNTGAYFSVSEDARWKWMLFDLDLSYQIDRNNVKEWFSSSVGSITTQNTTPFRQLMRNAKVRDYFLTRFGELLATTLSADNVVPKIEARTNALLPEMPLEFKRWKWTEAKWKSWVKRTIGYAQTRPTKLVKYVSDAFKLSPTETQHYFGQVLSAPTA